VVRAVALTISLPSAQDGVAGPSLEERIMVQVSSSRAQRLSVDEQTDAGRAARGATPRSSLGDWSPDPGRHDPVALLAEQDAEREPDLVPVRHSRMAISPFTFFRGAARIMAHDLASVPVSGLRAQICGDAHLSNVGLFASPERRLLLDLNDFDETLPGPWEWDVARMAASVTIAARSNGYSVEDVTAATRSGVAAYRDAMAAFAKDNVLDVWYASAEADEIAANARSTLSDRKAKQLDRGLAKARARTSAQALAKLGERTADGWRIRSQPPLVVPLRELAEYSDLDPEAIRGGIERMLRAYKRTLADDRRLLLDRFEVIDIARKVVGVGSVGTRAFIVLLRGRDDDDPLFLQVKQATRSVLEEHLPSSRYKQHGQRVVQGQRLMQAASDIFLGWTLGIDANVHVYVRQFRDMKGSADVDGMEPAGLSAWSRACGWTLARAHARSGSPTSIAAYLGSGPKFDDAMTLFAAHYADLNDRDHEAFTQAIADGRMSTKVEPN
jgi:uncharacterized protein (DUF2252 family)